MYADIIKAFLCKWTLDYCSCCECWYFKLQLLFLLQVLNFVRLHIGDGTKQPLLAGNSVYVDLLFLRVSILGLCLFWTFFNFLLEAHWYVIMDTSAFLCFHNLCFYVMNSASVHYHVEKMWCCWDNMLVCETRE